MSQRAMIAALTIAGSDPSGGAGLQADLKTFQQLGVYGMSAITLLTVQNTQSVSAVQMVQADFVLQQIDAVLTDIVPHAIKIGALGSCELVEAVADRLENHTTRVLESSPVVVDPVMVSKHGHSLVANDFLEPFVKRIVPNATIITPNRFEAERICHSSIQTLMDVERAAGAIVELGARFALVKFGSLDGSYFVALAGEGNSTLLQHPLVESTSTHGTGCVLSAILTAQLALHRCNPSDLNFEFVYEIVHDAMRQVGQALSGPPTFGKGIQPVETRSLSHRISSS